MMHLIGTLSSEFYSLCYIEYNTHMHTNCNIRYLCTKRRAWNLGNPASSTIQLFFLPILEPDLNDAHVETSVLRQLFSHVPCWLRTGVVCQLEGFELLRRDRRPRPLIRLITVYTSPICQF